MKNLSRILLGLTAVCTFRVSAQCPQQFSEEQKALAINAILIYESGNPYIQGLTKADRSVSAARIALKAVGCYDESVAEELADRMANFDY